MKRWIALALLAALLLSGCSAGGGSQKPADEPYRVPEKLMTGQAAATVITYLPSADGSRLVQTSHEMVIPQGQQPLQAAVVRLLSETGGEDTVPLFGGGATLSSIARSTSVLMLDISTRVPLEEMSERALLNSVTALVNTVADNSQVEYVFLWVNGQAIASRGLLGSPLVPRRDTLEETWIMHQYYMSQGTTVGENVEAVFCTDASGEHILATVWEQSAPSLAGLMRLMIKTPGDTGLVSAIPPSMTVSKQPVVELAGDGTQTASVWFSSAGYEVLSGRKLTNLAAAVTMSIGCNYPDIDRVLIYVDNKLITALPDSGLPQDEALSVEIFSGLLADMVTLYFPHQQSGQLIRTQRAAGQEAAFQLRTRVEELIRGPLAGEDPALTSAFPVGITAADVLSVTTQGTLATVNFSENFQSCYPADGEKERQMIYSIVNALTEDPGIRRVQILVEDRRVGALGEIDLTNPLIRNPGMIAAD